MAVGPIPWTSIDRFVQSRLSRGWIDPDEAADLETLICALDDDASEHRAKAAKGQKGDQADE